MTVQITLTYDTPEEAATALARLGGVINPADRPDAGQQLPLPLQPVAPPAPTGPDAATVFGGLATVAALPGVPTPPAPSTAAAAVPPTVPTAPTGISPPVPSVPSLPASVAPTVAAPTVPAAPTTPAAVELDSTGLPWDDRIHSSPSKKSDPKPTNADGSWRKKRGTADTYYDEVVKQLRAATQANAAAAPAVPVVAVVTPPPVPVAPVAPVAAVVPPPVPVPPAPAAPPAPPAGITFGQMVMKYEKALIGMNKEQLDYVASLVRARGITSGQINDLMHAPNVVPLFDADMAGWLQVAPGVPA